MSSSWAAGCVAAALVRCTSGRPSDAMHSASPQIPVELHCFGRNAVQSCTASVLGAKRSKGMHARLKHAWPQPLVRHAQLSPFPLLALLCRWLGTRTA